MRYNFGSYEQYEERAAELYPGIDWEDDHNSFYKLMVQAALDDWSHEFDGSFHELLVYLEYDDWEDSHGYFTE